MELPKPVAPDRPDAAIRDLDDAHLEDALRLWENGSAGTPVAFSLADVLGAIAARQPALVALVGGEVAGAISARVDGERAWVLRWSVAPERRRQGLGGELLRALERRLLSLGVRDISMIVPGSGEATETAHCGVRAARRRALPREAAAPFDLYRRPSRRARRTVADRRAVAVDRRHGARKGSDRAARDPAARRARRGEAPRCGSPRRP